MKDESATRGGLRPLVLAPSKRLFLPIPGQGWGRSGATYRPPDDLPDGAAAATEGRTEGAHNYAVLSAPGPGTRGAAARGARRR